MKKFKMGTREILELLRTGQTEKLDKMLIYNFLDEKCFSQILKDYDYRKLYYSINHNMYICDGHGYIRIQELKQQKNLLKSSKPFVKLDEFKDLKESEVINYQRNYNYYNYIVKDLKEFDIYDYKENDDNYCYYTRDMCNIDNDKFKIGDFNYNYKYLDMVCQVNKCEGFYFIQDKNGSLRILDKINDIMAMILPVI